MFLYSINMNQHLFGSPPINANMPSSMSSMFPNLVISKPIGEPIEHMPIGYHPIEFHNISSSSNLTFRAQYIKGDRLEHTTLSAKRVQTSC